MAYQTYTTRALVVASMEGVAADRTIVLFTRDAGLVHARAVSVRKETSKLRYGLQDFSLLTVSLIRGRQGWRVVGAERCYNLYFTSDDRAVRGALLRTVRLLRRLIRGEEAVPEVYDALIEGLESITECEGVDVLRAERTLVLRLLAALGYIASSSVYAHLLEASSVRDVLALPVVHGEESATRAAIDRALAFSHL